VRLELAECLDGALASAPRTCAVMIGGAGDARPVLLEHAHARDEAAHEGGAGRRQTWRSVSCRL